MPETENLHGANLIDPVYGDGPPAFDDPAETYFEASKLHLRALSWDVPGGSALEQSEELRLLTQRAARVNSSRPLLPLPEPEPVVRDFTEVVEARRSAEHFDRTELCQERLSGMLERTYRVRLAERWPLRPVPSGGALYPLDLYVIAQRVADLPPGMYHYNPFQHGLSWLREVDNERLHLATLQPEMARDAAVMLVVGASFWRSRFKYGQRGLRFCLLEAGHLMQNLLLTGHAYGMATRPIGGFLDDDFTENLDYDGINEAPVYVALVGPAAEEPPG